MSTIIDTNPFSLFSSQYSPGGKIIIEGQAYTVDTITDDNEMTIVENFEGTLDQSREHEIGQGRTFVFPCVINGRTLHRRRSATTLDLGAIFEK